MVNRAFTVRSLEWMEPLVDEVADDLLSALVQAEPGETPLTNAELVWLVG